MSESEWEHAAAETQRRFDADSEALRMVAGSGMMTDRETLDSVLELARALVGERRTLQIRCGELRAILMPLLTDPFDVRETDEGGERWTCLFCDAQGRSPDTYVAYPHAADCPVLRRDELLEQPR